MKKNAVGYLRTAVEDSTGKTLQNMEQKIRQYCDNNDLHLLKVFKDNGASGMNFQRNGWLNMKAFIKKNKNKKEIQCLVTLDPSRIGREMLATLSEIKELEQMLGMKVYFTSDACTLELPKHQDTIQKERSNRIKMGIRCSKQRKGPK